MTALIDIGNTTTVVGLARGSRIVKVCRIPTRAVARNRDLQSNENLQPLQSANAAVMCSVVPELCKIWESWLTRVTGSRPIIVNHKSNLGMGISYPHPSSIGGDRLANAAGASFLYGYPAIIADFGTALTFDVIDSENSYIGGAIAPGLSFMTDYLADRTALLPRINIKGNCPAVGRSTSGAMRLGARVGYSGMVKELVRHLRKQLGSKHVPLVLTGGSAGLIGQYLQMKFQLDSNLTLKGLRRIYELNKG